VVRGRGGEMGGVCPLITVVAIQKRLLLEIKSSSRDARRGKLRACLLMRSHGVDPVKMSTIQIPVLKTTGMRNICTRTG
jgi:hypothetical protein